MSPLEALADVFRTPGATEVEQEDDGGGYTVVLVHRTLWPGPMRLSVDTAWVQPVDTESQDLVVSEPTSPQHER